MAKRTRPVVVRYDVIASGHNRRVRATIAYDFERYTFRATQKKGAWLQAQAARFWEHAKEQVTRLARETGYAESDLWASVSYEVQTHASWQKHGPVNEPYNKFNHSTKPDACHDALMSWLQATGDNERLDEIDDLPEEQRGSDPWRVKPIRLTLRILGERGKVPNIGLETTEDYSAETRRLLDAVQPQRQPKQPARPSTRNTASGRFAQASNAETVRDALKANPYLTNEQLYRMFPARPKPSVRRDANESGLRKRR